MQCTQSLENQCWNVLFNCFGCWDSFPWDGVWISDAMGTDVRFFDFHGSAMSKQLQTQLFKITDYRPNFQPSRSFPLYSPCKLYSLGKAWPCLFRLHYGWPKAGLWLGPWFSKLTGLEVDWLGQFETTVAVSNTNASEYNAWITVPFGVLKFQCLSAW